MLKLQYNNRTILNSARTGYVGFTPKTPTMTEYVNLGDTEYTNNTTVSLTGMPSTSNYNYLVIKFDAYYNSSTSFYAADISLRSNNTGMWRSRMHYVYGIGFVGITGNVTGWTTEAGQSVTSRSQDGVSYRLSSLWQRNNYYVNLKFLQDRTTYNCYFYINNTLIGYASMNTDLLTCNNIELANEVNASAKAKNIRVAGFANLTDAQEW